MMLDRLHRRGRPRRLWLHTNGERVTIRIAEPLIGRPEEEQELRDEAKALATMLADVLPVAMFNLLVVHMQRIATE